MSRRPGFDLAQPPTNLARIMVQRGHHSARALSLLCGLSASTVSEAAAGRRQLSNSARRRLAQQLDCHESQLIDDSFARRVVAQALDADPNDIHGAFAAPFDAEADYLERQAHSILALLKSGDRLLAAQFAGRLAARIGAPEPAVSAPSITAHCGRLISWQGDLPVEAISGAQAMFLDRARNSGGDLTLGVLQPLIDGGCIGRTTIYDTSEDLHIRHLASGVDHVPAAHRLWLHGRPATDLCAPTSVVSAVVADLAHIRDKGGYSVRRVAAELGETVYHWDAVTVRVGSQIIGACNLISRP